MLEYAIMGASLSAQGRRHDTGEVTGYTLRLINQAEHLGTVPEKIHKITYPGNRLSDAGLVRLQDTISRSPDICIVEPLVEDSSRGRWASPEEVFFIYEQLISAGILPVSFLVPLPVKSTVDQFPVHDAIMEVSRKFSLPVFVANLGDIIERGGVFNGVHTTAESGKMLAQQLVNFLSATDLDGLLTRVRKIGALPPRLRIRCYSMPRKAYRKLRVKVVPRRHGAYTLRLIQRQCIGPHSPVLSVNVVPEYARNPVSEETSVWDPFCHYERSSYVNLIPRALELEGAANIEIAVAEKSPDYASCRRDVLSWPASANLEMRTEGPLNFVSSMGIDVEAAYVG